MNIIFSGATRAVTGSMTALKMPTGNLLIDAGLIQDGTKNPEYHLPLPASQLQAVVLTHAHLDHSGYLPRLVREGFSGPIYASPATIKLARIILQDSSHLNEEFYNGEDVVRTLSMMHPLEWGTSIECLGGTLKLQAAGHILGASSVEIKANGKKITFSGDLGRQDDYLIPAPAFASPSDAIVMESTYGGKNRHGHMEKELHSFLMSVSHGQRVGIIASFAVARAQTLLCMIHDFYQRHPEAKVRVVCDSPMMKEASKVYQQFAHLTLKPHELKESLVEVDYIEHQGEWESLRRKSGPLIIISSSGMLNGGRINRHLMNWQDDARAMLFLPGYQAEGTPGRAMLEGQRQISFEKGDSLWWSGDIIGSEAFSSHAQQSELLDWVSANKNAEIFLIHGEDEAKLKFKEKLISEGFTRVHLPVRGESFTL